MGDIWGQREGVVLLHVLGEQHPVVGAGHHLALHMPLILQPQGGDQGADADSGGSQVVHLVDLQNRVDLAGVGQNIIDLIGGDGVQAAAEGI